MEPVLIEQFFLGCLAHASYLVGSEGIAAVIDPQRDVDIYIDAAAQKGLRIAYIVETHLHADFVSGHRELAERTGARICLGEGSGATFPHTARQRRRLHSVRQLPASISCKLPVTPSKSVCIAITDLAASLLAPRAVFTGDTLFVGDVGRPDLSGDHTPQGTRRSALPPACMKSF